MTGCMDLVFSCLKLDDVRCRESRDIDKELHREKRERRRQMKILLLGAGESGKSTFLKQMRILHGDHFNDYAIREFIATIRQNIITGVHILIEQRDVLGIPWQKEGSKRLAWRILHVDRNRAVGDEAYFRGLIDPICILWDDEALKSAFDQRTQFQLGDSIKYFLTELPRIGLPGYRPTNADILHARKATQGIAEHLMYIQNVPFLFVDVGGQRSQRPKWFQCFDSVNAILFLAAVNEYNQILYEDGKSNRLQESCDIFDTIVNNMFFAKVPVILFLNKTDLLQEKYLRFPINDYLPGFQGDSKDFSKVQDYLLSLFDVRMRNRTKLLYHHWTSVIDTEHTNRIFSYVREEIRKENLRQLGLF